VISGDPVLVAACAAALKQWKFKPFIRNGKPIRVSTKLPCDFKVPDDSLPVVRVEDRSSNSKEPARDAPETAATKTDLASASSSGMPAPARDSTALVLIKKAKVSYPLEAEQGGIQGEAVVRILVAETGDFEDSTVLSGNPILTNAVVEAARKWKFEPFVKSGKPTKAAAILTWDFAFKDKIILDKSYDPAKGSTAGTTPNAPRRVRVSAGVTQGMLIYKVEPVYPYAAKTWHIQGSVVLAAVIGKDGGVKDLRVISGPRELVDASIGAVQQWRYKPFLLMGDPVEVDTNITVNFTLH
jgi:TonB family protein